jgi:hypothetical protein
MSKRTCGTCTKCCEGWLSGEALGHKFYGGKPCHFIAIGKGCTVYAQRPKDPCVSFKCGWLSNADIPEWFKPDEINAIIKFDEVKGIPRITLIEAGGILESKVLSWFIQYALSKQLNFAWQINGGINWIGSPEFNQAMINLPNDKNLDSEPKNLLPVVSVE